MIGNKGRERWDDIQQRSSVKFYLEPFGSAHWLFQNSHYETRHNQANNSTRIEFFLNQGIRIENMLNFYLYWCSSLFELNPSKY